MDIFSQANLTDIDFSTIFNQDVKISASKILMIILGVLIARMITKQTMYIIVGRILKNQNYGNKKEANKRKNTLVSALNTITTVLYAVIGFILILSEVGVNISALVTAFGALGVVLGIAGQSVIKDFLRGMSILFYDQMRVGDVVEISGESGTVENISLQVVRLRDLDGDVHVIPNGDIKVVTNKTNSYAHINMDIMVAYDNDIDKVEEVVNKVGADLAKDPKWTDRIIEPIEFLRVDGFGDVSVEIKLFGTVQPGEQWPVAGEYRRRLKKAFEANDIDIPYPQRIIHSTKK